MLRPRDLETRPDDQRRAPPGLRRAPAVGDGEARGRGVLGDFGRSRSGSRRTRGREMRAPALALGLTSDGSGVERGRTPGL